MAENKNQPAWYQSGTIGAGIAIGIGIGVSLGVAMGNIGAGIAIGIGIGLAMGIAFNAARKDKPTDDTPPIED